VSTPVPPAGLSFWSRLVRPNRWRLWTQFALLGTFILVIPILLTSYQLLLSGRTVLVEHEIIDLADESNLRVNDFREDMAYLARDVRRLAVAKGATPDGIRAGLKLDAPPPGDPADVRDVRRKYLYGTLVGVYRFPTGNPDAAVLPPASTARTNALRAALAEVDARLDRNPRVDRSGLHSQPADGDKPARCLLAIGERAAGGVTFAAVIDFGQYVGQRQEVSPRHYYLVTDPAGRLLVRPNPMAAGGQASVADLADWQYPTDDGKSWFDPLPTADAKKRRLAKAVSSGGARLTATEVPTLAFRYRKGYFGDTLDLTKTLGEGAKPAAAELNALMAKEIAADPRLRCGEVSSQYGYVELSHPDPARLRAVSGIVEAWWKRHGSGGVRWTRPIDCRTFQGQLVPLRLDLNDADEPGWLIVAAAIEELREDIDDRFDRIHTRWVLPTLAVSLLLGVGLVVTLTHSLNRLARAAVRLGAGEDVRLPLGGSREVGDLAQTLDEMVRRVRQRDRELSDRAARYQTILRAAGEGVVISDAAGVIEEANKAAGRMFGQPAEVLLGRTVSSLLHDPTDLPMPTESTQDPTTVLPPGQVPDSVRGKRPAGDVFWLEISQRPVVLPDRVVIVCVFRDVTRQRADAERIQRMNEELETRVRVRTAELEEANGKLEVAVRDAEAAVRAKDSFVANMSHELRQPLHIIIGFTEALKEEAADEGLDAAIRDLDKILSAAKHLLDLINDILDMAKISAGKMELAIAPFPLARLVEDVGTLVGPLAEANGNRFVIAADPSLGTMSADERRVKQILLNLLSNAFKFTNKGVVRFAVERLSMTGREWVRFRVADSGKGMTEEQVGRLFQRFYQADSSTTRGAGGTGLGLAITQSFNDLMGGQPIRVTSAVGDGSEFVVTLPAVVESTPEALPPGTPTPAEGTQSAEGRTVLVIDDDPNVRELMRRFLLKEGFAVVEAGTGDDGFAKARDIRPCVVTLDVMMPESDGWAVLARLKADPATADIPVVMLTIVDDRGRGYSLGAADYLTKPIDWNRLGAILRKYLARDRGDIVLVIDDDADNRAVIRRYLDREEWKTAEAADGEEGLLRFAETPPAIILLDLMMPVLDGFGFLDELAKRFPGHRVPVIVLTAKELTAEDFDRLNGRVARILEKGDLTSLENLLAIVRRSARPPG